MDNKPCKGTRDIGKGGGIFLDEIILKIKRIFELYGFSYLETPAIENYEILCRKFGGGGEILKEIFKLKDQGNRKLGLRFDFTVPLSRYVANNPRIKIPFKRYQIGSVWRDGPIKLGRYREFRQADVDVVGVKTMLTDAELLKIAFEIFKDLKLDVVIKFNNRILIDEILEYCGLKKDKFETVLLSIDKLEKMGKENVREELKSKYFSNNVIEKLFDILENKNSLNKLNIIAPKGVKELKQLVSYLKLFKVNNYKFDITLARGLNYYTGTIFEVFLKKGEIKSSLAAGGRYDNLIKDFSKNKLDYGAVGISFGIDVILDCIKGKNVKSKTKVFIIPIKQIEESIRVVNELRDNGINSDIDFIGRNLSKNLDYINKNRIDYVIFIGKEEIEKKKYKLRNMESGKEEMLSLKDIIKRLK